MAKGIFGIIGLGTSLFGAFLGIMGFARAAGTPSSFSNFSALQSWGAVGIILMLLGIAFILFDKD